MTTPSSNNPAVPPPSDPEGTWGQPAAEFANNAESVVRAAPGAVNRNVSWVQTMTGYGRQYLNHTVTKVALGAFVVLGAAMAANEAAKRDDNFAEVMVDASSEFFTSLPKFLGAGLFWPVSAGAGGLKLLSNYWDK